MDEQKFFNGHYLRGDIVEKRTTFGTVFWSENLGDLKSIEYEKTAIKYNIERKLVLIFGSRQITIETQATRGYDLESFMCAVRHISSRAAAIQPDIRVTLIDGFPWKNWIAMGGLAGASKAFANLFFESHPGPDHVTETTVFIAIGLGIAAIALIFGPSARQGPMDVSTFLGKMRAGYL